MAVLADEPFPLEASQLFDDGGWLLPQVKRWTTQYHQLLQGDSEAEAPRVGLEPTTNGLTVHTAQALCSVA